MYSPLLYLLARFRFRLGTEANRCGAPGGRARCPERAASGQGVAGMSLDAA